MVKEIVYASVLAESGIKKLDAVQEGGLICLLLECALREGPDRRIEIIAPQEVEVWLGPYKRSIPEQILFAARTGGYAIASLVRRGDIREEGRVILADVGYLDAFDTYRLFRSVRRKERGEIAHLTCSSRVIHGNYPFVVQD